MRTLQYLPKCHLTDTKEKNTLFSESLPLTRVSTQDNQPTKKPRRSRA